MKRNSLFSKVISRAKHIFSSNDVASQQLRYSHKKYNDISLQSPSSFVRQATEWGYYDKAWTELPKILIAAGHGYGNVGDEAQLGACVLRWRKVYPNCNITLFSPNPSYTTALHQEHCIWAPRITWFLANTSTIYYTKKNLDFRTFYFFLSFRLVLTAHLIRLGLPLLLCHPREISTINEILSSDIVHISGGGYLTGLTESRLWENALLMRICHILGVRYMLTGHNIGVFKDRWDRLVARQGLAHASYIGLRDKGLSELELLKIGVTGNHIHSTCDDALICDVFEHGKTIDLVRKTGADPALPWVAINFHYWGMNNSKKDSVVARFAELCDYISQRHGLTCLFISMAPGDQEACDSVNNSMSQQGFLIPYSPDYKVARSVIKYAKLCFTLKHHPIVFAIGEQTPVVSVSFDPYYELKNKGALANIGLEEYAIGEAQFHSSQAESYIDKAIENSEAFASIALKYVNDQNSVSLDPYIEALGLS